MKDEPKNVVGVIMMIFTAFLMMVAIIAGCIYLTGCTYSITMVHTEGEASDVVDETATNTPSTSLTVPVSAVPK